MSSLLYYSISADLSHNEIIEIDRQIAKNQEKVRILVKTFASNAKVKTRKLIVVIILGGSFYFSNVQPSKGVGLPMPVANIERVQPSYRYDSNVYIAKVIPRKNDLIVYKSPKDIVLLMYLTDPRISSNQEVLKLVKKLRGGSWGLVGTSVLIGVIIFIFSMTEGFIPNIGYVGRNLDRIERLDPFQPQTYDELRYPPVYNLLFPRKTCYADRPGGSLRMAEMNRQSSREELTQLSNDIVPTQTQISGFVKNGKVDLNKAFSEVNRRASAIGCETFDCSFDRFKKLATECGEITSNSVREAITILQGEMQGYYKNARRVNYGSNVNGLDFAVDGLEEFKNITHAEAKNLVGSAIQIADGFDGNIWKQGKETGKKSVWQKKYWSNRSRTSQIPNLNSDAYLPKSVNSTLTVVDCYDVPNSEKQTVTTAINFGAKNDTNLIILNNRTNI